MKSRRSSSRFTSQSDHSGCSARMRDSDRSRAKSLISSASFSRCSPEEVVKVCLDCHERLLADAPDGDRRSNRERRRQEVAAAPSVEEKPAATDPESPAEPEKHDAE